MLFKGTLSLTDLKIAEGSIKKIAKEMIAKAINKSLFSVKSKVAIILGAALESSEEWKSILSGRLRQEFGLSSPETALAQIKSAILNSISVVATNPPDALGGMRTDILPIEVEAQLANLVAYDSKGGRVDWLNWLLFSGTSKVISDAKFQIYNRRIENSRAGFSLMLKSEPLGYSVNSQFSGTTHSNWFDRVLLPLGPPTLNIMLNEVKRNI